MWWTLPTEIVEAILSLVPFHDYVALTQTSAELRELLDTRRLFLAVARSNFGLDLHAYNWSLPAHATRVSLLRAFAYTEDFFRAIDGRAGSPPEKHGVAAAGAPPIAGLIQPLGAAAMAAETPGVAPGSSAWSAAKGTLAPTADEARRDASAATRRLVHQLRVFATDELYFVPIAASLRHEKRRFSQALAQLRRQRPHEYHAERVDICRLSWARKLFQLVNYAHAVKTFRDRRPDETADVESCYYELARCSVEFESLAPTRLSFYRRIEESLQQVLPVASGGLHFRQEHDYMHFLKQVLMVIIPHVAHTSAGSGGNILRIYKGIGYESLSLYLSVVAKALQTFVFDRINIKVGPTEHNNIRVCVAPMFLVVGEVYVSISFEQQSINIYQKKDLQRLPEGASHQVVSPMTCHGVIQRAFEARQAGISVTQNPGGRNWAELQPQTSEEKSRFVRMILLAANDSKSLEYGQFCPLLKRNDFFLYYLFAEVHLKGSSPASDIPSSHIEKLLSKSETLRRQADREIPLGTLVVNRQSDYLGLILGHGSHKLPSETGCFFTTVPFDKAEITIAHSSNVEPVAANGLQSNLADFLQWLVSTEGINYAGTFLFTKFRVENDFIQFA